MREAVEKAQRENEEQRVRSKQLTKELQEAREQLSVMGERPDRRKLAEFLREHSANRKETARLRVANAALESEKATLDATCARLKQQNSELSAKFRALFRLSSLSSNVIFCRERYYVPARGANAHKEHAV